MNPRWQLYRWGTESQRNYMTFYMTYKCRTNNHSYWQLQALHPSIASSLSMLAVLICEKFHFYERIYEILVQISFSSLHFCFAFCIHSIKALCTSSPPPGYCWVRFLFSINKVPLLKTHHFWLFGLQNCSFMELNLSSLLTFLFLHVSFIPHSLFSFSSFLLLF